MPDEPRPFIERWERHSRFWIVVAALVPLIPTGPTFPRHLAVGVGLACWAVFVADFLVHLRCVPGFMRTGWGVFDAVLVIATFPFGAIMGLTHGGLPAILRLARVVRILAAGANIRVLIARTNMLLAYVALVLGIGSLVIYQVEAGTEGFDDFGDALWFSIVTMTTVGYGDLVPQTTAGRAAASVLMIFGIGLIGAVAGILTSYLGLGPEDLAGRASTAARRDHTASDLHAARAELEASAAKVAALLAAHPDPKP